MRLLYLIALYLRENEGYSKAANIFPQKGPLKEPK